MAIKSLLSSKPGEEVPIYLIRIMQGRMLFKMHSFIPVGNNTLQLSFRCSCIRVNQKFIVQLLVRCGFLLDYV